MAPEAERLVPSKIETITKIKLKLIFPDNFVVPHLFLTQAVRPPSCAVSSVSVCLRLHASCLCHVGAEIELDSRNCLS